MSLLGNEKWAYKVIASCSLVKPSGAANDVGERLINTRLNALTDDGWKIVSVNSVGIALAYTLRKKVRA